MRNAAATAAAVAVAGTVRCSWCSSCTAAAWVSPATVPLERRLARTRTHAAHQDEQGHELPRISVQDLTAQQVDDLYAGGCPLVVTDLFTYIIDPEGWCEQLVGAAGELEVQYQIRRSSDGFTEVRR
jgi:L-lactate utilization protein LutB